VHICLCICKNIGVRSSFGSMTVESVGGFRHFASCSLGNRLAILFIVPQTCMFWGASFELITNLATVLPKKVQGFHWSLIYHRYMPHMPHIVTCLICLTLHASYASYTIVMRLQWKPCTFLPHIPLLDRSIRCYHWSGALCRARLSTRKNAHVYFS